MTDLQICQRALYKNGHFETLTADALTAPATKAESLCAEFYPPARREVFRMQAWTCIRKRRTLINTEWAALTTYAVDDQVVTTLGIFTCTTAGISDATEPTWDVADPVTDGTAEWDFTEATLAAIPDENLSGYAYAFPMPGDYLRKVAVLDTSGDPIEHTLESNVLYTDEPEPVLVYVYDETDPDAWDPLLQTAVVLQLASELAYPLTGSHENETAFAQAAAATVSAALTNSKREARKGPSVSDPWMTDLFPEVKR